METLELTERSESPDIATMERADIPAIWESFGAQLLKLKKTAETLTVTDVSQTAEMKIARTTRFTLRDLRIAIENKRVELGEEALKKKQKIDAEAKKLKQVIEPLEARLLEQEKFAEVQEEKRRAELKVTRTAILAPLGVDVQFYDLAAMPDEAFQQLVDSTKAAIEAKKQAAIKAEQERIAKEKAEAEAREAQRLENERLKKEAAERESAIKAEREAAAKEAARLAEIARKERAEIEAKAKAEREVLERKAAAEAERAHQEKVEAEKKVVAERLAAAEVARKERVAREEAEAALKAKLAAEAAEQKARELAEKKAKAAPDKVKLQAYSAAIKYLTIPECSTPDAQPLAAKIAEQAKKFTDWIDREISGSL